MLEPGNALEFQKNNPGAVKHGNFINYYQFHPAENRIQMLPLNLWQNLIQKCDTEPFVALDIGCNAGNLTFSIYNFLKTNFKIDVRVLGVDIDPILVDRAKEQFECDEVKFFCLDVMSPNFESLVNNHLKQFNEQLLKFSAIFCFSTTMWIHLNHGDNGLKLFLRNISQLSDMLIIEPQPWKCYKSAVKRVKSLTIFPLYKSLQMTGDVESHIVYFIVNTLQMQKKFESEKTSWKRKIFVFTPKKL